MKALNLAIAFLLEVLLLVALSYWGFHLGHSTLVHWLVGLAAPGALVFIWGRVAAPKAEHRLERSNLLIFKIVVFTLGAVALFATGQKSLAIAFEAISLLSVSLSFIWKQ